MGVLEMLEDDDNYYIACEILEGGELFDKLMEVEKFTEKAAGNIIE